MAETKTCPKCGTKNSPSNNFCDNCGAKLPAHSEKSTVKVPSSAAAPAPIAKTIKTPDAPKTQSHPFSGVAQVFSFQWDWRTLLFVILVAATLFTRFDHLGFKPHHHDESMHAFYSFKLFTDGDYEYNPMMHGPFQFHGNALMYYLFGVSDATSRYLAASFGILTVVLAMLLGPFIGRTASLLATLLIVISPSFMYFDRFTREDAYILGGTFLMVTFLWRYYRSRKPLDFWLASVGFTIGFCTKESMFITIATIGTYFFLRMLPWFDLIVSGGLTALGLLFQLAIPKTPGSNTRMIVLGLFLGTAFAYVVYKLLAQWVKNVKEGPESNFWDAFLSLGIQDVKWETGGLILWFVLSIAAVKIPSLNSSFFSALLALAWLGLIFRFAWLWLEDRSPAFTGAVTLAAIIFTLLFTTFFTVGAAQATLLERVHGFVNALYQGAFGGLEYWWQQHDVHRGDQPWYYYLVQLPANELVSFLLGSVAMVWYGLFRRKNMPLFLSYWFLGHMALFSWAGEKMPWLILHPLLPLLLLTAYFVGDLWENVPVEAAGRAARTGVLVIFGLLSAYSLHSAIGLAFYREADPVEPLVYVQSGLDTKEVVQWVEKISYGETGATDLHMTIEDKCSWPFAWFLRDYKFRGHPTSITAADNPLIMSATESDAQAYPILDGAGYVNRKYKLRVWWVPSWFKKGFPETPMSLSLFWDWFWGNLVPIGTHRPDMVEWNDLVNWALYRQVWSDMGSYNMRLWVRPDLAAKYGFTNTTRSDVPADYPKAAPPAPAPTPKAVPVKHHKSAQVASTADTADVPVADTPVKKDKKGKKDKK